MKVMIVNGSSHENGTTMVAINEMIKVFDEEGVKLLNDININTVVESLFISINSYGMKSGMMLSDDIMELPLKRIQHSGSYDIFKDESVKVFKFFDHVDSKKQ